MRNRIYIKNDQKAVKTDAKLYGLIRRAIGQALKYEKFPSAAEIVRQMREERDDQIVPELAGIR